MSVLHKPKQLFSLHTKPKSLHLHAESVTKPIFHAPKLTSDLKEQDIQSDNLKEKLSEDSKTTFPTHNKIEHSQETPPTQDNSSLEFHRALSDSQRSSVTFPASAEPDSNDISADINHKPVEHEQIVHSQNATSLNLPSELSNDIKLKKDIPLVQLELDAGKIVEPRSSRWSDFPISKKDEIVVVVANYIQFLNHYSDHLDRSAIDKILQSIKDKKYIYGTVTEIESFKSPSSTLQFTNFSINEIKGEYSSKDTLLIKQVSIFSLPFLSLETPQHLLPRKRFDQCVNYWHVGMHFSYPFADPNDPEHCVTWEEGRIYNKGIESRQSKFDALLREMDENGVTVKLRDEMEQLQKENYERDPLNELSVVWFEQRASDREWIIALNQQISHVSPWELYPSEAFDKRDDSKCRRLWKVHQMNIPIEMMRDKEEEEKRKKKGKKISRIGMKIKNDDDEDNEENETKKKDENEETKEKESSSTSSASTTVPDISEREHLSTSEMQRVYRFVIGELEECEGSGIFESKIDKEEAPGYRKIITKEMTTKKIKKKISKEKYGTNWIKFAKDVRLMLDNCQKVFDYQRKLLKSKEKSKENEGQMDEEAENTEEEPKRFEETIADMVRVLFNKRDAEMKGVWFVEESEEEEEEEEDEEEVEDYDSALDFDETEEGQEEDDDRNDGDAFEKPKKPQQKRKKVGRPRKITKDMKKKKSSSASASSSSSSKSSKNKNKPNRIRHTTKGRDQEDDDEEEEKATTEDSASSKEVEEDDENLGESSTTAIKKKKIPKKKLIKNEKGKSKRGTTQKRRMADESSAGEENEKEQDTKADEGKEFEAKQSEISSVSEIERAGNEKQLEKNKGTEAREEKEKTAEAKSSNESENAKGLQFVGSKEVSPTAKTPASPPPPPSPPSKHPVMSAEIKSMKQSEMEDDKEERKEGENECQPSLVSINKSLTTLNVTDSASSSPIPVSSFLLQNIAASPATETLNSTTSFSTPQQSTPLAISAHSTSSPASLMISTSASSLPSSTSPNSTSLAVSTPATPLIPTQLSPQSSMMVSVVSFTPVSSTSSTALSSMSTALSASSGQQAEFGTPLITAYSPSPSSISLTAKHPEEHQSIGDLVLQREE
ncbi:putative Bromodomain [Monocercomonoides exilis]|uniref:putative Bromodomain n=1 Tax=Monocercomonoides exilis TaxID=2049356 RepID=UPI0035593E84|nr:putative Bromodomain [Monocercomonoides exilis]|eukprot:MONOS_908.1-p1 / transcript=MONOS_908.1 / gene=MONOS_908 / organism=Monocercomonoides_exilis_PA203 / gene_product=unspecified product / transcript_product=unspecified product / location=Mono_scaffold00015:78228-81581(+) / protein_length=1117 / sequence_SO=supercontig / SO=protein_coding / is_pseudo=false